MRRGFTIPEVLISAALMATVLVGMALFQTATLKVNGKEKDRAFAIQKSIQMMEEILAYQVTSGTKGTENIDTLAQGDADYSYKLTIDPLVTDPKASLSGNREEGAGYRFVRQIRVEPISNEKGARRVTVAVWLGDGNNTAAPKDANNPLSLVTNVVKAQAIKTQPTQAYDMYLIDIENVIGWWADPNKLRPILTNTIDFLKSNNPGLDIRTHWVRRLAYGRDSYYKPISNKAKPLNDVAGVPLDSLYFYPGKRDATQFRYNPDVIKGQLLVDGTINQGAVDKNTYYEAQGAYTFADQFNHAVRYQEEVEKYNNDPNPNKEMSLRMLLDRLGNGELKNAIIVNLHAEMIPVVPLRNYSDAARVPQYVNQKDYIKDHWGVDVDNDEIVSGSRARLVTHPRQLYVEADNSFDPDTTIANPDKTVNLFVHPYLSSDHGTPPPDPYQDATIVVRDIEDYITDWNNGGIQNSVQIDVCIPETSGSNVRYVWKRIWPTDSDSLYNMSYAGNSIKDNYLRDIQIMNGGDASKGYGADDLRIRLKNLPYTHSRVKHGSTWYGFTTAQQLHEFNYFPDPYLPDLSVGHGGDEARFTGRVRIAFKVKSPKVVEVLTTIGHQDKLYDHQAPNRSRTWVWVGTNVPFSEQYQIVGDPRHNPHLDTREQGKYNRYFANFSADAYKTTSTNPNGPVTGEAGKPPDTFPGTLGGWDAIAYSLNIDVPRYFEFFRRGLLKGNGLFVNPAGYSFYYYGMGGEIYEDENTMSGKPFGLGAMSGLNDITLPLYLPKRVAGGSWYAKPWLGELYPDDQWASWMTTGNLPSASFNMVRESALPSWWPDGTGNWEHAKRLAGIGCQSFFNGGSTGNAATSFNHYGADGGLGQITTAGQLVANSFKMYLDSEYPASRPFDLGGGASTSEWNSSESVAWRTKLEWGLPGATNGYYKQNNVATAQSLAPIVMRRGDGAGGEDVAYMVMAALAPTQDSGTTSVARVALASALQGFFDMASPTFFDGSTLKKHEAIKLPPRVNITEPVEDSQLGGSSVKIKWNEAWSRWNTETYTSPSVHSDYATNPYRPNRVYNIKYSTDGGTTWKFINGSGTAKVGVYEPSRALTGLEYTWNYSGWPNREYLVRLECYRNHTGYLETHYAYHQVAYTIAH